MLKCVKVEANFQNSKLDFWFELTINFVHIFSKKCEYYLLRIILHHLENWNPLKEICNKLGVVKLRKIIM